jgi:hypothetical protein
VLPACPTCGYDLTGLEQRSGAVCPECGGRIDSSAIIILWRKACDRAFLMFFLAPIMALPGLIFYVVGQPVLCFALAWFFGYRAMSRTDKLLGVRNQQVINILASLVLAFAWTVLSFALLSLAAVVIAMFVRDR